MKNTSTVLFEKAQRLIPGGVNSPVRAGRAVGVVPPFIASARGCYLTDVAGNTYIDFVGSWGPMILGHTHPEVVRAVQAALGKGTSYGAPIEAEIELAEIIVETVPSIEMVRMVNSGTEATMSAIRLVRAYTGRTKIVKFDGCYHGHADSLLVAAGSGVATLGIPGSPGVPADLARHTLTLPFNDLESVAQTFQKYGPEIAAIIVEPVPANMGVVLPKDGFLQGLRQISRDNGALLIFDEVISGFRIAPGGAQERYGVIPDITCLGKIIGGGLPVGAYGGRKEVMERIAPVGDVYQAGTLSGNPLAMAAGLATLRLLAQGDIYDNLDKKGEMLFSGIQAEAEAAGIAITVNRMGSMGSVFFTPRPVTDFESVKACDTVLFGKYYATMLNQGIYLAPSAFEASFVSTAHGADEIQKTVASAGKAFRAL